MESGICCFEFIAYVYLYWFLIRDGHFIFISLLLMNQLLVVHAISCFQLMILEISKIFA